MTTEGETPTMTWKLLAGLYPEFVQWVVQRYCPQPDGPISRADYDLYAYEYERQANE
jgi:hypothetical protein